MDKRGFPQWKQFQAINKESEQGKVIYLRIFSNREKGHGKGYCECDSIGKIWEKMEN